jgi:hypothetical protein
MLRLMGKRKWGRKKEEGRRKKDRGKRIAKEEGGTELARCKGIPLTSRFACRKKSKEN